MEITQPECPAAQSGKARRWLRRNGGAGTSVIGSPATPAKRRERERRLRRTLRQAMQMTPGRVEFPGLEVRAASQAADGAPVGGDFCDAFLLGDGDVALVLGDVSGHGLPAARYVPEIKFALRAFLSRDASPERALARLNDWLCIDRGWADAPTSPFVTAVVIVLNSRTGLGTCALAGAEGPLHLRPLSRPESLGVPGMALGITARAAFGSRTFQLGLGDLLLLTTDGITEARREGQMLGAEGAARLATDAWWSAGSLGRPAICRAVLNGARRYAGGTLSDDATVLTACRVPESVFGAAGKGETAAAVPAPRRARRRGRQPARPQRGL